jgi:hypothetical protein
LESRQLRCREALKGLTSPPVNKTDVVNRSGGMGDDHDGCDIIKVAAKYAAENAEGAFQEMLTTQLGERNAYVLKCMLLLAEDLARHQANSCDSPIPCLCT